MQEYARQAKDLQLLADATDIRFRAEQRAGEMLATMEKNKGAEGTGSNQYEVRLSTETAPPTLAELGVTKTQSSRWQKLAALPTDKFEIRVEHAKARVAGMTTSAPRESERAGRRWHVAAQGGRSAGGVEKDGPKRFG